MNKRELFRDIISQGGAEFEETVFQKTLRTAKRNHRIRVASRSAIGVAIIAWVALQFHPRHEPVLTTARHGSTDAVRNETVLRSQPFQGTIQTVPIATEERVLTIPESVFVLKTGEADPGKLNFIDDDQLLSFFPNRAVALVHRGPHSAELILLEESPKQ